MQAHVLQTERLILRRMVTDDQEFILELLNEPSFLRNIGDRGVRTPAQACQYILDGPIASYDRYGFGLYVVERKEAPQPIGICGLLRRDWLEDVDIGFALLPRYWSRGYAFESASAVMGYGREVLGLSRIVAVTSPDNEASMGVLGKLGLKFERMIAAPGQGELRLFGCP